MAGVRLQRFPPLCFLALLVVLLAGCAVSRCPRLEPVGESHTLEVATWNVMRFGNDGLPPDDDLQLANVACVIRRSGVDLWALQEMEDRSDFQRLLERLGPDWDGVLDASAANLHLGYVFRRAVVRPRDLRPILTDEAHAFAGRPPLLLEADIVLPGGTSRILFINLHMKAFDDAASLERRSRAATLLKSYLDAPTVRSRPFLVLGDFNDRLMTSVHAGADSPYVGFVADTTGYHFATYALDVEGEGTYCFDAMCSRDSAIDHILVSDELFKAMVGPATRYDALLDAIPEYVNSTSDHLPAVLRLQLP